MSKWGIVNPPKKEGRYLISTDGMVCIADRVEYPKNNWYWNTIFMGNRTDKEVQGWQKLPKPINKQEKGVENE